MPFLIADCNNFFASCERVFDASLHDRPLVILSNNDGCVISRSAEARKIGIQMAVPAFECEALFRQHNVAVRSANFPLYGDMSQRVMNILKDYNGIGEDLEVYSIDEAFLGLPKTKCWKEEGVALALEARARVLRWTGIPVSIGVASTKTLAKLSNGESKRRQLNGIDSSGVFCLEAQSRYDQILDSIPVGHIWGIGFRLSGRLEKEGICTVLDLKRADPKWVLKHLSITGLRTQRELNGEPCLELDEVVLRHTVLSSRSFGEDIRSLTPLKEAVATFTSRAAEKLRKYNRAAGMVQVFLRLRRPKDDSYSHGAPGSGVEKDPLSDLTPMVRPMVRPMGGWYGGRGKGASESAFITLPIATSFTPPLVAAAHRALEGIYRPGAVYAKGGVLLADLCPQDAVQLSLFDRPPNMESERALMKAMDNLNRRYGERTLYILGSGVDKGPARSRSWQGRRQHCSPRYTTCWEELFTVGEISDDKE